MFRSSFRSSSGSS